MHSSTQKTNKNKRNSQSNLEDTSKDFLLQFFEKLPKSPSHYCRKNSSKLYIEPVDGNNVTKLYLEYKKSCEVEHVKPLSRRCFDITAKERNIAFYTPKKDRCDICIGYETKNISKEEYDLHIKNKEIEV